MRLEERSNFDFGTNRICFITGPSGIGQLEKAIQIILKSGIKWVQYREKDKTRREVFSKAVRLREITRKFGACLIINDYADIALAVDADGVHLGQDDMPLREARRIMGNRIIGISTHSVDEALEAERDGADYIGFGSIFPTATKEVGTPKGVDGLRAVKNAATIPVIAIGGIKPDNVLSVFETGCECVAVSSGLLGGDIKRNAQQFLAALQHLGL